MYNKLRIEEKILCINRKRQLIHLLVRVLVIPVSTQINMILKFARKMVHLQIIFGRRETRTHCGEGLWLLFFIGN